MRHRMIAFTSVVSLMLCLGFVALWVRSYWVEDWLTDGGEQEPPRSTERRVTSADGVLYYQVRVPTWDDSPRLLPDRRMWHVTSSIDAPPSGLELPEPETAWSRIGFYDYRRTWRGFVYLRLLAVPFWLPALLLAIAPALRLKRIIADRHRLGRTRRGQCPACGYDLRATPSRCPECGCQITRAGL